MNNNATRMGSIELTLAMILSGTIGYFVIQAEQSHWNVVFFRCVIGALTLGLYAYFTGRIKREYFQKSVLITIVVGGVALVANWVFLFASFNYIPFSIATVVYHMQPLFLVLLGAYLTKDSPSKSLFMWLTLAFIGLFLMVELDIGELWAMVTTGEDQANGEQFASLIGMLMALAAALLYTVTTLMTKKVSHIPPHFIALVQVVVGIFMLLPFTDWQHFPTQIHQWKDLLILGVIHTGFMYIIMYDSFQKLPTSLIALLSFIYPITALVVDYLAFATQVTGLQALGVVLTLLAICAVKFNWSFTRKKHAEKGAKAY